MLADPARAVQELADLLERAWEVLVEPHWPRLRALLEADIAYHSRRLAEVGLERLLGEISPRLRWTDGTLTVGRHQRRTTAGSWTARVSSLMPSVFVWPDVVGGFEPPWQPAVIYPARGIGGLWTETADRTPRRRSPGCWAAARADVLCALGRTGRDDARWPTGSALAPSSVSAHLSALRAAGLLTSRRYGHQVLYERTPLGIALAAQEH